MDNAKRWCAWVLAVTLVLLAIVAGLNAWTDPFFHYRAPRPGLSYHNDSDVYMNDGLLRNTEYDAVLIGSSETMNFRASECEALFGYRVLKVPHANARNREIYDDLQAGFRTHGELKAVFFGLDYDNLLTDKDLMLAESVAPDYLRDDRLLNDINYLLNRDVLLNYTLPTLMDTARGRGEPDWDDYLVWSEDESFGDSAYRYAMTEPLPEQEGLTEQERQTVRENIGQNILSLAQAHPDTCFYVFVAPYSIAKLYTIGVQGNLLKDMEAEREAAQLLLTQPNIRYFSFLADFETICDLDNYIDAVHYGPWINSKMLRCMKAGEYELRPETLAAYFERISSFYLSYDYQTNGGQEGNDAF